MKIGLFDSGLGGLTILRAVARSLPDYDYRYYGDTANVPYGDKTEAEVLALSERAIRRLFAEDCVLVIVACNTASADTLRTLQDSFIKTEFPERRVLGVIVPTLERLTELSPERTLILATNRTARSGKYERECARRGISTNLTVQAMPTLVPRIEAGEIEAAAADAAAAISAWQQTDSGGVVVLACTHYTVLTSLLRTQFPELTIISQDEIIPKKLAAYLTSHPELTATLSRGRERNIFLTEHRADYDHIIAQLLHGSYREPGVGEESD